MNPRRFIHTVTLLILCLLAGRQACAQYYVGAKVGYGGGTARLFPQQDMGYVWTYKNCGVSWKYYSAERVVGAVQVDLEWMERGYQIRNDLYQGDSTTYFRHLNSVNIPFSWQPYVYFFKRHLRVFLNAGINLSYNFSASEKRLSKSGSVIFDNKYDMQVNRDNRFGYGLSGGLGAGLLFGRLEYFVEGRYYYGYSDILKNRTIYQANPVRSQLDNINLSFGVFYRFGKGGILAPTQAEVNAAKGTSGTTQFQKMDSKDNK